MQAQYLDGYKIRTQRLVKRIFPLLFLLALVVMWNIVFGLAQEKPKKTLYDRLGGVYSIATVVDDFIERLLVNNTLNANPKIKEARDRVPKAGLKFQVTALVSEVTGGPQKYTGRSMKEAHRHLNITEKEWQAMADDFKKSLDKFKVPEPEQKELFAIVGTTKPDIVVAAKPKK